MTVRTCIDVRHLRSSVRDPDRVTLTPARWGVASQTVVFKHKIGIISMEAGPDGTLYFSDRSGIYRLALV
jgi:hypothetical protein